MTHLNPTSPHSDQALTDPADDQFGRAAFATRVARQLAGWRGEDTFVVSLTGDCGSGKTTAKNFIRHALENGRYGSATPLPTPCVVEFNAWEWSGQEHLLRGFWQVIADQLRATPATAPLADLWLQLGVAISGETPTHPSAPSQRAAQAALATALRGLAAPVVLLIDDVDRLSASQLRLLAQMIKVNANVPRFACVLVFQRNLVIEALGGAATPEVASEFLRKLIQLELELPDVPEALLRRRLEQGMDEILAPVTFPARPRERWADVFSSAVWPLFATPRDVKRFLSALSFQVEIFLQKDGGVLEVNPIDLVLVETLRMFAHPVYLELRDTFRRRETRLVRLNSGREEERKEARVEIDRALDSLPLSPRRKRAITSVLQQLLPLGTGSGHGGRDDWDRDLRLCSPRHVERYFHQGTIADALPAHRLIRLARATTDRTQLETLLLEAADEKVLSEALDRLPALLAGIPENQATIATVALCGICDKIPAHAPEELEGKLVRFACELFSQLKNPLKRENVIDALLDDPDRLTGPILFLHSLRPRSDVVAGPGSGSLSIEQFRRLVKPAASKLQASASSGAIWRSREAAALIKRWSEWSGEKEEVQRWLLGQVKEPANARVWLRSFLSPSSATSSKELVLQLEELGQFCDPATVAIAANQADGDSIDRAAAKRLGQILAAKGTSTGFALRTITVSVDDVLATAA